MIENAAAANKQEAMLMDAGEDLLRNTFVVASRFRYLSKDELVAELSEVSLAIAAAIDAKNGNNNATMAANLAMIAVKASIGNGYYVRINSHLFQWHWDDEVADGVWDAWGDEPAGAEA